MALSTQPLSSQTTGIVYIVLGLDPNQTIPTFIGWGTLAEVRAAADDYVSKNPRVRAMILQSFEYINATASLRSVDAVTGEERKRPVPEAVRVA